MGSVPDLIKELGGYRAVASLLGLPPTTVASWKSRESIAVDYWVKIIDAARERGLEELTYEKLVEMHTPQPEPTGAE